MNAGSQGWGDNYFLEFNWAFKIVKDDSYLSSMHDTIYQAMSEDEWCIYM